MIQPDGTGLVQVTDWEDILAATWSPDGTRFHVTLHKGTPEDQVYTMATDGSDVVQLTTSDDFAADSQWSPDGSKLLAVHGEGTPRKYSLIVIDVASRTVTQVTPDQLAEYTAAWVPS